MGNGDQEYNMARQGTGISSVRTSKPKKREDNGQFLKRLMDYSQNGAVMQAFIINALIQASDRVANMPFEKFEKEFGPNSLFHPLAWHQTAKELQEELNARLK